MPIDLHLVLFIGGAFFAALAGGITGTAFAVVASAVWLHLLPPAQAVPLIVAAGLTIHLVSLIKLHAIIRFDRLMPFLLGGIFGVPLGIWVLAHADPAWFRLSVGLLMIGYTLIMLVRRAALPGIAAGGRGADGVVGLAGGVLGGAAGLSGVLPTLWCDLRGWPKDDQRGVYQPFILAMHLLTLALLGAGGLVDRTVMIHFALALPALLLGSLLGVRLYRAATALQFRRILLALVFVSGVALVA